MCREREANMLKCEKKAEKKDQGRDSKNENTKNTYSRRNIAG